MIKRIFIFLGILFSFSSGIHSQVLDGSYYIRQPLRSYWQNEDPIKYSFPELKDPVRLKKLIHIADYFRVKYSKPPIEIKDAVYFSQVNDLFLDTLNEWPSRFFLNARINKIKQGDRLFDSSSVVYPASLRFYCDSAWLTQKENTGLWEINGRVNIPLEKYLRPFYFGKYEVTNKEYRQFVYWVRDSLLRTLLGEMDSTYYNGSDSTGNPILNWKKKIDLSSDEAQNQIAGIYLPQVERFYTRKEIDARKLNYTYNVNEKEKDIINVYPDTLCWVHDFTYSYLELLTNDYFWHPAFDDYPVVGISYKQATAFLHWKTIMEQKKLDVWGLNLKIRYDLPSEVEWEIASTAEKVNGKINLYSGNYDNLADNSWTTDLVVQDNLIRDTIKSKEMIKVVVSRRDFLSKSLKRNFGFKGLPWENNSYQSLVSDLTKLKGDQKKPSLMSYLDENNISFMGGNVSEWLKESYSQNWERIFKVRQELLSKIKGKDVELLQAVEAYYDSLNEKLYHGESHLVRGANWLDNRHSMNGGKNMAGMNAKTFCNEYWTAHSTIGFRYVVHVSYKDEKEVLEK